jgi:hypothetical protein
MVYRPKRRNNRGKSISGRQRGFAVYILLGIVVTGMMGMSFSNLLNASFVKASFAVGDDLKTFKDMVAGSISRRAPVIEKGEQYYTWESMVWISDIVPAMILVFGRPSSTLGIDSMTYIAHRKTTKYMNSFYSKLMNNGLETRGKALAKMFRVFWGGHGAVIIPSVDDQFDIEFVSPQVIVFPEGKDEARRFWNKASGNLVSSSSPVSFMDIVW